MPPQLACGGIVACQKLFKTPQRLSSFRGSANTNEVFCCVGEAWRCLQWEYRDEEENVTATPLTSPPHLQVPGAWKFFMRILDYPLCSNILSIRMGA